MQLLLRNEDTVTRKVAGITGVVFTLKQVLWSIYGPFQDLEYRMAMVKAVARATDEEFVMLKGNARELGASTEYTATEQYVTEKFEGLT